MNKSNKYRFAASIAAALFFQSAAGFAANRLIQPLVIAVCDPIVDEQGDVLAGNAAMPGDLVQVLLADTSTHPDGVMHPPGVDGTPHPDNPLLDGLSFGVGNLTLPQVSRPGTVYLTIPRTQKRYFQGKRLFVRVFNAPMASGATFYGDSDQILVVNENVQLVFTLAKTDSPLDTADDDQDGLNNSWEASFGTDPNNPDTDGDGILDGEDVWLKEPPELSLPEDAVVACGAGTGPEDLGYASARGECEDEGGSISIGYADTFLPSVCPSAQLIQRTWTASDSCGGRVSGVQTISMVDGAAPVFTTRPEHHTLNCSGVVYAESAEGFSGSGRSGSGRAGGSAQSVAMETFALPPVPQVSATDDCDSDVDIELTQVALGECPGVVVRTWTATDDCGLSSQVMQMILIEKDCVQPLDYWRDHPENWLTPFGPVEDLELGCAGEVLNFAQVLEILRMDSQKDETIRLAQQLVAALLNVSQGAEQALVAETIEEARDFLCAVPIGTAPKGELKEAAKSLWKALESFNEGQRGSAPCP